jgi:hypothetical protein
MGKILLYFTFFFFSSTWPPADHRLLVLLPHPPPFYSVGTWGTELSPSYKFKWSLWQGCFRVFIFVYYLVHLETLLLLCGDVSLPPCVCVLNGWEERITVIKVIVIRGCHSILPRFWDLLRLQSRAEVEEESFWEPYSQLYCCPFVVVFVLDSARNWLRALCMQVLYHWATFLVLLLSFKKWQKCYKQVSQLDRGFTPK